MKREARGATRGEALGLRHEGEGLGVRGLLEEGRGVVVIVRCGCDCEGEGGMVVTARGGGRERSIVMTVTGKGAWL